jgi:hypothetical protein
MSGPFPADEFDENSVMLVCLVEEDSGELDTYELYLSSSDEAYEIMKHFSSSIEPLEVTLE